MTWIAFFSQTGSEIVELAKSLDRKPTLLVTNNFEEKIKYHPDIRNLNISIMYAKHDMIMNYFRNQKIYNISDTFITLHGYLRVLPSDICGMYKIFNGHPAPVHLYPELKGKDKQEDLYKYKEKYDKIGCVVHRVTENLDEGNIIVSVDEPNTLLSVEDSYIKAKPLSLKSWEMFFNNHLVDNMKPYNVEL